MTQFAEPRHRTLAVYILFALAVVAGVLALLDAARYMGWLAASATLPIVGEIQFVLPQAKWFAALMSAVVGIIWFVVAKWLWDLNPSGWLFVVIIAIFNLILLFLAILGRTMFSAVLPEVAVNAVALILALLAKDQFIPRPAERVAAVKEAVAEEAAARQAAAEEAAAKKAAAEAAEAQEAAAKAAAAEAAAKKEAAAAAAMAAAAEAAQPDDLTKIEGVGPVVSETLAKAGINTYDELRDAAVEQLRAIMADAGIPGDPSTWPAQAGLAAAGNWDELEAMQDELKGGRVA